MCDSSSQNRTPIRKAVILAQPQSYSHSHLLDEFNVAGLIAEPIAFLSQGLSLKFKPLNMDVLPLYIVLMAIFPIILRTMLSRPDATLICSLVVYFAARQFGWNLPAWPGGAWYFNPFAWQLLFVLGAWCALVGKREWRGRSTSKAVLWLCAGYLALALAVSVPQHFGLRVSVFPPWLLEQFASNDKTNLPPYRVLHFVALAVLTTHLIPRNRRWLSSWLLYPAMLCGRRSLEVFCVGIFLSFVAHFILELVSASIWMQVAVSFCGIAIMTGVAWVRSWSIGAGGAKNEGWGGKKHVGTVVSDLNSKAALSVG